MADNYSKMIFIILITCIIMLAFIIGGLSGIVIYEVKDLITQNNRTNLMILYEVKE